MTWGDLEDDERKAAATMRHDDTLSIRSVSVVTRGRQVPEALDRKADRALYLQIADQLREQSVSGKLARGSRLPSEYSLMAAYGASRDGVRKGSGVLKAA